MPRPFRFCLCADDYAMTPGVSRGIREALDAGAVTATSVMTTSPWWPEEAPALGRYVGRADLGLHLNLTSGAPLGPMPVLAPDGRLPTIGAMMRMARGRAFPSREVADEIGRQMDRFVAVLGRPPDHVDGHQHVHVLRPIRAPLLDALDERGWTPWLRDCSDRLDRIVLRGATLPKAVGLSLIARGWRGAAVARGLAMNEGFAGFSDFDASRDYAASFARYLRRPGPRQLVMCHPGYADDALRVIDPVVETRERELAFLVSDAFRRMTERAGASPVPLATILPLQGDGLA